MREMSRHGVGNRCNNSSVACTTYVQWADKTTIPVHEGRCSGSGSDDGEALLRRARQSAGGKKCRHDDVEDDDLGSPSKQVRVVATFGGGYSSGGSGVRSPASPCRNASKVISRGSDNDDREGAPDTK